MNCYRYDQFIKHQRNADKQSIIYNNYVKEDAILRQKTKWETGTDMKIKTNANDERSRRLKVQREEFLNIRRKKLSDLLIAEEEQYRHEIIDNEETPYMVRKKMEKKLNELKMQRELDRQKLVNKLEAKRFYNDADELRKNDSEYTAISCYYEQENQMLDKLKQREKEKHIEETYAQLNEFDRQKKIEREEKEKQESIVKNEEMVKYLNFQKEQNENQLKEANMLNNLEKQKLKEQWEQDAINEKQEELNRLIDNKRVAKEVKEYNLEEERIKNYKKDLEKKQDSELINSIIQKEKALDEIDKQNKLKRIEEFKENEKYLNYIMNRKKEAEAWMDKLAMEEAEKEYEKEQKKWMAEQMARIQLLKEVYQDRERAVLAKKNIEKDERERLLKERAILDNQIKLYNEKVIQMKKEEFNRNKVHQSELIYQMKEKENRNLREKQQKLYEERAAQLWEMEYQRKINEQRAMHLKRLEEIKNKKEGIDNQDNYMSYEGDDGEIMMKNNPYLNNYFNEGNVEKC